MTDQSGAGAPELPSLPKQLATAAARHLIAAAGGALVTAGAVAPNQEQQFETIALGLLVWAAGYGWSWLQKKLQQQRLATAMNAPKASPPVKV